MAMDPVRFSGAQRAELRSLGLIDEVLHDLEVRGLPTAKRMLTHEPPRAAVRDELEALEAALKDAHAAVKRIMSVPEEVAPQVAAARRVAVIAGPTFGAGAGVLRRTLEVLGEAVVVAVDAVGKVPESPARHRTAGPMPIEALHESMQFGRLEAGLDGLPFELRPSASPTSPFRKIMGICYEAIGAPTTDPERAIKAYIQQRWAPMASVIDEIAARTEPPPET